MKDSSTAPSAAGPPRGRRAGTAGRGSAGSKGPGGSPSGGEELSKGERTRLDILHKALQMSTTQGLEGLSIGSVAKAVGMSKSGLFAHFESKEDLQLQVLATGVDYWIRRVAGPAMKAPRGEPRVRAIYDGWMSWEKATFLPGGCPFIAAAVELDSRPGPLRDYLKKTQIDALDALATSARLAVEQGHFRADLDLQQFAHDFYSIILGYHHFSRLLDDERAGERARQAFEELMARSKNRAAVGAPSTPSRAGTAELTPENVDSGGRGDRASAATPGNHPHEETIP